MKGIKLELGGSERTLRYDLEAIALIGEKLGVLVRLAHFQDDLLEMPLPLSAIRTILWAGLLHEDAEWMAGRVPALEQRTVGHWITQDNLVEVLTVFFGLFSSASPETQDAIRTTLGLDSENESEAETALTK